MARAHKPPGTQRPRLYRPRLHWELIVCGIRGHELIGTDAARLHPDDELVAREQDGLRWYRCVRCDSWLPLAPPDNPKRELPPAREEIELPLRGKALRDKIVLRIIAVDRAVHFVVLAALSVAAVLFASHELRLRHFFYRVVNAVQGTAAGPHQTVHAGFLHGIARVFNLSSTALYAVAAAAGAYAILEGAEAVGLWYQKRWAEYLTFVATLIFLPYEIYELSQKITVIRVGALVINLAVATWLLFAKRLFGLRGGAQAEEQARAFDVGWEALERTAPSSAVGVDESA